MNLGKRESRRRNKVAEILFLGVRKISVQLSLLAECYWRSAINVKMYIFNVNYAKLLSYFGSLAFNLYKTHRRNCDEKI